jgi:hypothetical protein
MENGEKTYRGPRRSPAGEVLGFTVGVVVERHLQSQRKYILRIGRNKSQTSRNLPKLSENQRGDGTKPEGGLTTRRRGPGPGHDALW